MPEFEGNRDQCKNCGMEAHNIEDVFVENSINTTDIVWCTNCGSVCYFESNDKWHLTVPHVSENKFNKP